MHSQQFVCCCEVIIPLVIALVVVAECLLSEQDHIINVPQIYGMGVEDIKQSLWRYDFVSKMLDIRMGLNTKYFRPGHY